MEVDQQPATKQPQHQRTSRKHQRSSDDEDVYPDWSSDVSGQFDDAEEAGQDDYRSPTAKSVKRRRSNDWPLPEESADYGSLERRGARAGYASLVGSSAGMKSSPRASPRASPRGSLASLRNRHHGGGGGGGGVGTSSSPRHWSGRRSRFIEASMSDSISEKPPSVFTREGKPTGSQRQSGIFRFGKAIAAAFNPFGGWGKTTSPESNKAQAQPQTDALSQAEQAYAELKKTGYKGTNKGAYIQSQHVDSNMADQTWESIKENVNCGGDAAAVEGSGRYSTEHGGDRSTAIMPRRDSGASSKRSSFQDLRKAKIPFMKTHEAPSTAVVSEHNPDQISEDSEGHGIRRQRSKKELSRQAKLLKKVNNLEDKLDRARRELRELTGNEDRTSAPALPSQTQTHAQIQSQSQSQPQPPSQPQLQPEPQPQPKTMCMEMDPESYPRKFVPGALPTLPSERLLDQQAAESESSPDKPSVGANVSQEEESRLAQQNAAPVAAIKSPKRRSKEPSRPSSMGKDSSSSSSRKRKSPVPESLGSGKSAQPRATESIDDDDDALKEQQELLADYGFMLSPPPRQAKWQKFEAGDSPGSVERKRTANEDDPDAAAAATHKMSPYQTRRRSATPHSAALKNRSPNSKSKSSTRSPPPSRSPARATIHAVPSSPTKKTANTNSPANNNDSTIPDSDAPSEAWPSPSPASPSQNRAFYLQPDSQLNPDRSPRRSSPSPSSSPSKRSPNRSSRTYMHEDIPPVPPLPKELLPNAAKVNKSPTKSPKRGSRSMAAALEQQTESVRNRKAPAPWQTDDYPWPEDIF
ncbi:hypothetical protein N7474_000962 [Penicillium riverlandense]|uniref:uncharacterized protein n=1 Tax=Penicillium riverlandense TaxID=1903569 RepID=UPI002546D45D|nr:uncharacterized protein N7474_000962 [Penicillium riverlandense]KAJ5832651.1 hypothetical protein N7474_000962 [Penicillium riverlandense]